MYSSRVTAASSTRFSLSLGLAQRGAVDGYGMTVVPQAAQQSIDHRLVAEEVGPLVVVQVRCNDCWMLAVAFLHQLEKDVGLLWFQIQISKFIDQEDVQARKAVQQSPRGAIGQGCVHLVEQVLSL